MTVADRLYITKINHSFDGDVYFPDWEKTFTRMVSCTKLDTGKYNLEFMVFEKSTQTRG
jgi:dihydrofolate reductase